MYPAIPKHTGPEAEGSNPTTGLTLLWARNPFRGNFNHWRDSWEEAGQIFWKNVIEYKICVLTFFTTFVWNISHSKKNLAGNYHKCM
jgi:hypothetical protein